jgi:hypothetical protein
MRAWLQKSEKMKNDKFSEGQDILKDFGGGASSR